MIKEEVHLLLMYEPGNSHIQSILSRAELPLQTGLISALPEITVIPATKSNIFYKVILTVLVQDKAFWLGFAEGMNFCINNRGITVGVD
jgi:hypothetical protein